MLLIPNATNDWMKSWFFLLPTLHPGIQLSCLQEISVMQYTCKTWHNPVWSACACYKCVHGFHTAYAWQLSYKQLCWFPRYVVGKQIKILSSRWWRFITATSAVKWLWNVVLEISRKMWPLPISQTENKDSGSRADGYPAIVWAWAVHATWNLSKSVMLSVVHKINPNRAKSYRHYLHKPRWWWLQFT